MKQVPQKLIAFSGYLNGGTYLGVADVTLPDFESLTSTVSGAGILGEIDSPSIGLFASMTCAISWRTVEEVGAKLLAPLVHALDFRGVNQVFNNVSGQQEEVPVKATLRAIPKKFSLGKMENNATTDSSNEFEVVYVKLMVNGKTLVELDKLNYIFIVDGIDYLAKRRANLGL